MFFYTRENVKKKFPLLIRAHDPMGTQLVLLVWWDMLLNSYKIDLLNQNENLNASKI